MLRLTQDEVTATAESDHRPFSNHSEFDYWAGKTCYECVHDNIGAGPEPEVFCPILSAAMLGNWPSQWTRTSEGRVDTCTDFEQRTEDNWPPPPPPPPEVDGQTTLPLDDEEEDDGEEDEANIICVDCDQATVSCSAPPFTPCSPEYNCAHDGTWEWYMLTDEVWALIGNPDCLCIGCVEKRLGRPLNAGDFADLPINEPHRYDTPRLTAARSRSAS